MSEPIVITGVGAVAPHGWGEGFWTASLEGRGGIGPITQFDATDYPCRLAGEIEDFDEARFVGRRLVPQTDRSTRIALAAGQLALEDAAVDLTAMDEFDMGVVTANFTGGFAFGQKELQELWSKGSEYVSAYQSFAWFYAVNTGQLSIRHGLKGPSGVVVTDESGALDALAQARRNVRRGAKAVLAGAIDSSLCSWGVAGLFASGRVTRSEDPRAAYLPFDSRATGQVPGEGGAMFVLEPASAAVERGHRPYAVLAGHASTFDPEPDNPSGLISAATLALQDAGLQAEDVDVVFADGAGQTSLDTSEAEAITKIFGARQVPVTVPKTMTGRLHSGGSAVDVAWASLALRHGEIPPTINVTTPDDHVLDLVTERSRTTSLRTAMVLARGAGGFNSAVVLTAA
ncbi:ketosynthase chain-length factor [Luteipulveratus mongoliensis]|uniref:Beta-ketoacyl synthase n=1 Tax=Luteipulveratus mongoliensis TaxID=571913 RepID=A0A0K1JFK9_9MICO|nr:ketosynthase chain-length factor [Luteipulveratus mongoliensis]AKU15494.1 beta-ketoacyl synthase [Luteipulveratus mongoliensis]